MYIETSIVKVHSVWTVHPGPSAYKYQVIISSSLSFSSDNERVGWWKEKVILLRTQQFPPGPPLPLHIPRKEAKTSDPIEYMDLDSAESNQTSFFFGINPQFSQGSSCFYRANMTCSGGSPPSIM